MAGVGMILFLFAVCSGVTVCLGSSILEITGQCAKETGVLRVEKFFKEGVFDEDNKLKCFMKCVMVENKEMTADGTIDYDNLSTMLPMLKPFVKDCKSVTGSDPCDNAFQFHKCLVQKRLGM